MVGQLILVLFTAATFLVGPAVSAPPAPPPAKQVIPPHHPLIYYRGRWDSDRGTWWYVICTKAKYVQNSLSYRAGSGFKLSVRNLKSLTLDIGEKTSGPFAPTAVSLNNGPFVTYNLTTGANVIDVNGLAGSKGNTLVKVNVEGWQQNRLQLKGLEVNRVSRIFSPQGSDRVIVNRTPYFADMRLPKKYSNLLGTPCHP